MTRFAGQKLVKRFDLLLHRGFRRLLAFDHHPQAIAWLPRAVLATMTSISMNTSSLNTNIDEIYTTTKSNDCVLRITGFMSVMVILL